MLLEANSNPGTDETGIARGQGCPATFAVFICDHCWLAWWAAPRHAQWRETLLGSLAPLLCELGEALASPGLIFFVCKVRVVFEVTPGDCCGIKSHPFSGHTLRCSGLPRELLGRLCFSSVLPSSSQTPGQPLFSCCLPRPAPSSSRDASVPKKNLL